MRDKIEACERWKDVRGYEGTHQVSSLGQVRSLRRHGTPTRILRSSTDKRGYPRVTLRQKGQKSTHRIHRIVLIAFAGPCPHGLESAHLNGVPGDNRISNLVWTTHIENCRHRKIHGTQRCGDGTAIRGEKNWNSVLRSKDVLKIRRLIKKGSLRFRKIAAIFGVCEGTISDIKLGRSWKWLASTEGGSAR